MKMRLGLERDEIIEIDLPDGWQPVWEGLAKPGDMYLHSTKIHSKERAIEWIPITFESFMKHEGYNRHEYDEHNLVGWYTLVIRETPDPVGKPCPVCECRCVVKVTEDKDYAIHSCFWCIPENPEIRVRIAGE